MMQLECLHEYQQKLLKVCTSSAIDDHETYTVKYEIFIICKHCGKEQ